MSATTEHRNLAVIIFTGMVGYILYSDF